MCWLLLQPVRYGVFDCDSDYSDLSERHGSSQSTARVAFRVRTNIAPQTRSTAPCSCRSLRPLAIPRPCPNRVENIIYFSPRAIDSLGVLGVESGRADSRRLLTAEQRIDRPITRAPRRARCRGWGLQGAKLPLLGKRCRGSAGRQQDTRVLRGCRGGLQALCRVRTQAQCSVWSQEPAVT